MRENGKITSSQYQTLNAISKKTATNDLTELVGKYELLGIMDKIQAILEMIASNGQNSGCFFV